MIFIILKKIQEHLNEVLDLEGKNQDEKALKEINLLYTKKIILTITTILNEENQKKVIELLDEVDLDLNFLFFQENQELIELHVDVDEKKEKIIDVFGI